MDSSEDGHRNNLLKIENLTLSISHRKKKYIAIDDISFSLHHNELLAIVGESGSGKTLSILSILKILPPNIEISSGKILFNNEDLATKKESDLISIRGKKIGIIFQDSSTSLNPTMKIGQQIKEILHHSQQIKDILKTVGILQPYIENCYPHELSGGMRQRIAIAIALAALPQILIADEPTSSLDAPLRKQILHLFKDLKNEKNRSIILVTHDIQSIKTIADRIIVMYGGRIIEEGKTEKILSSPKHPYTKMLLQATPSLETKILKSIDGAPPNIFEKPLGCPFAKRCPHTMAICLKKIPPFFSIEDDQKSRCFIHHKENFNNYGTFFTN